MTAIPDNFFHFVQEPEQSMILYLRDFLMRDMGLTESWKNNTPFYYYQKKWFAFISYNPKNNELYISFVKGCLINHKKLLSEGRKQQRIYCLESEKDIDMEELKEIIAALKTKY